MKKFSSLFVLLIVLFAMNSYGQLSIGPMLGPQLSNVTGDETDENAMLFGYHFGVAGDWALSDAFGIQLQALFSAQGTQDKDNSDVKTRLNYVNIPLLARYRLKQGIMFQAGPYLGILTSAKFDDGTDKIDIKDVLNSTDFGLKFGAGYMAEKGYGATINYALGLANLNKDSDFTNHNGVISLSLFYLFPIMEK